MHASPYSIGRQARLRRDEPRPPLRLGSRGAEILSGLVRRRLPAPHVTSRPGQARRLGVVSELRSLRCDWKTEADGSAAVLDAWLERRLKRDLRGVGDREKLPSLPLAP